MKTLDIICRFADGTTELYPIEDICTVLGRGVHGADYLKDLAQRAVICSAELSPNGEVILLSTEHAARSIA